MIKRGLSGLYRLVVSLSGGDGNRSRRLYFYDSGYLIIPISDHLITLIGINTLLK
jgi:hypothetical protein